MLAGRYLLSDVLGTGGMGAVYRAYDVELDEVVALKLIHAEHAGSQESLELFRREVKLARRVTHKNVARIYELGEHEGARFLTMELISGEPLSALIKKKKRLSVEEALPIVEAVAQGLAAAHEAGVVHRDIKPANILLGQHGRITIGDFGIAYALADSSAQAVSLGTPSYVAPEVTDGKPVTPATDIFAFGASIYEMLVGFLPWRRKRPESTLSALHAEPPPDPRNYVAAIPRALAELILRCLAHDPAARPKSAPAVAEEYRSIAEQTIPSLPAGVEAEDLAERVTTVERGDTIELPAEWRRRDAVPAIGVLPFHAGGDPFDEPLGETFTAGLIDALSHLRGLRVLSYGAVRGLSGPDRAPSELGAELGVAILVFGSISMKSNRITVDLNAVEVDGGASLLARRFEGSAAELAPILEQAARALAKAAELDADPQPHSAVPQAALELYLRARQAYHMLRLPELRRSIALFREALQHAPEHAVIHAGLAMALVRLLFLDPSPAPEVGAEAYAEALRALELGPQLGEPHLALGITHLHRGELATAAGALRAAIARSPSLAEAQDYLGRLLVEAGCLREGQRRLSVALGLDREATGAYWELARALVLDGQRARAFALMARLGSTHHARPIIEARYRSWFLDRRELERLEPLVRGRPVFEEIDPQLIVRVCIGKGGAEQLYAQLERGIAKAASARRRSLVLQIKAEIAVITGDDDLAAQSIVRADAHGLMDLAWLDRCPLLERLRRRADFVRARASVNQRAGLLVDSVWG